MTEYNPVLKAALDTSLPGPLSGDKGLFFEQFGVGGLLELRTHPFTDFGVFTDSARVIADKLDYDCAELFPRVYYRKHLVGLILYSDLDICYKRVLCHGYHNSPVTAHNFFSCPTADGDRFQRIMSRSMEKLTKRQQEILRRMYGLDGVSRQSTSDIAQDFYVNSKRIRNEAGIARKRLRSTPALLRFFP